MSEKISGKKNYNCARVVCYLPFSASVLNGFPCSSRSVLQQAGRNPSHATLDKYWTPRTSKLNFDDFCEILKCEKKTEETELMRAFKKMDVNGYGFITHNELEKVLTTVSSLNHFLYQTHLQQIVYLLF